jgi:hypothetical protein
MARRIIDFIDWAARVHFVGTMAWSLAGWAVTFFGLSLSGWDPGLVWVGSIVVGAGCAIIFIAARTRGTIQADAVSHVVKESTATPDSVPDLLAQYAPDLRVADSEWAICLFDGSVRDKLLPLLEQEKLLSWARPMHGGEIGKEPAPVIVAGKTWRTHSLHHFPAREGQFRAQTFLKTKGRHESTYYDLFLNRQQIDRLWPEMVPLFRAATSVYEQIEDHMASAMVEIFADTAAERLIAVCEILARPQGQKPLVSLYGNHPPSREIKQIYMESRNRFQFVVEDSAIVLKDNGDRFENLCVPFVDIEPAIRVLKARMKDA